MFLYPGKNMAKLIRYTQSYWTKVLKEYEISSAEYPIIIALIKNDGMSQEKLAFDLGIDKSAVTRTVQALIKKDLLIRQKDEEDLRCYQLHLTEKGKQLFVPIQNGLDGWNTIVQQNISEEEFQEFNRTLSKILDNVDSYFRNE